MRTSTVQFTRYFALSMKRIHFEWFTEKNLLEFSLISSWYEVMMRVQPSIGHPWLVVSGQALGGAIWPWSLARSHHRQCRQSSSGFHPAQSWPGALPWPADCRPASLPWPGQYQYPHTCQRCLTMFVKESAIQWRQKLWLLHFNNLLVLLAKLLKSKLGQTSKFWAANLILYAHLWCFLHL